ncbi:MAG TPA: excinuclease ABC subunit UvrC [Thermodesulfobacteriota bacterium]
MSDANAALDAKLAALPTEPGVYQFKDARGQVLYVGKAKSLRHRVRSYFQRSAEGSLDPKTAALMSHVADLETLVVRSEKEALLLEANLIKTHRPRYNIVLRDDKQYLHLRLDLTARFPRLQLVRKPRRDQALYFGPFASAWSARQTERALHRFIPIRSCNDFKFRNHRTRPCLEYQIKRCAGPCCGLIDEAAYRELVEQARLFLSGRSEELTERFRAKMAAAAEALDFETAARIRDQIAAIDATLERQQAASTSFADQDVIGLYREGSDVEVRVLRVREGKLVGADRVAVPRTEAADAEIVEAVLSQYYHPGRFIPAEVLIPMDLEDREARAEVLSERKGRRVHVLAPERGEKARLVALARENAAHAFREERALKAQDEALLEELARRLALPRPPRRIEGYDISNTMGRQSVGSMVVFEHGTPARKGYRRFRIKTVEGANDFASLYEVLRRRFRPDGKDADVRPDLILIDGGKAQLGAAVEALKDAGLQVGGEDGVAVLALAKDRFVGSRRRVGRGMAGSPGETTTGERIFLPGRDEPLLLPPTSSALFLLERVRDEAHRFAITYHRELRRRRALRSVLEEIPGIGAARRRALLAHFGSVRRVKGATPEELAAVPGLDARSAREVYSFFHGEKPAATFEA